SYSSQSQSISKIPSPTLVTPEFTEATTQTKIFRIFDTIPHLHPPQISVFLHNTYSKAKRPHFCFFNFV
ncbi:MAG: hypothetical protein WCR52_19235, partial [Bacteroidota bacterium]